MATDTASVLIIEPFCGGSHQQLVDLLQEEIEQCVLYSLPAKKWQWRARTSAIYFSQVIPHSQQYRVLFCSSVLNLAELVALRPDLSGLKKVVYFHENQLVYPVRKQQDRDFQFGYNQVLTCLVADTVLFNSAYNKESFLTNIPHFMKLIPDHRPKGLSEKIRPKCLVLYFPIKFPEKRSNRCTMKDNIHVGRTLSVEDNYCDESVKCLDNDVDDSDDDDDNAHPESSAISDGNSSHIGLQMPLVNKEQDVVQDLSLSSKISTSEVIQPLVIAWPHRWEHDKNPELFFKLLYMLKADNYCFKIAVMGETYTDVPSIFDDAAVHLKDHILTWGYQETKSNYYKLLQQSDIVVSTAKHEFFGVAMLEATYLGCYPLVPNDLVYPEIFPKECLYNTENQLYKRLKQFCQRPQMVRSKHLQLDFSKYSWQSLKRDYIDVLHIAVNEYLTSTPLSIKVVSSGGLVIKHPALGANGRRFEPRKRSKLFQGLISQLTTSWVADHVKWRCRLH
ncbi:hypothetical protein LSH36_3g26068 [Paralvinella palmiformis]|uniref:tRNA-queuosine alpha-mannosyltransferase n=1 Tax=Paralvinella palmiformis TaxID=53620 RepID=A0AAD9KFM7_9ANNE|nr:hypothetical protein LSH36_3g26068 [Paralvinella palmiformis]